MLRVWRSVLRTTLDTLVGQLCAIHGHSETERVSNLRHILSCRSGGSPT